MKRIIIKNGTVAGFADELNLTGLEVQFYTKTRVSHIVPENCVKRFFFQLLRSCVSDTSWVAGWTRNWSGPWVVLIAKKYFGPFDDRATAICFEKEEIARMGVLK